MNYEYIIYRNILYKMTTRNWRAKNIRSDTCSISRVQKTPIIPVTYTQTFSDVGTFNWVVPDFCESIEYLVVGGGGGGGGSYDTGTSGGGGGGRVVQGRFANIPSCGTLSVVVGQGGSGGTVDRLNSPYEYDGVNGQTSSFGAFSADGGLGGYASRQWISSTAGKGALNPSERGGGGGDNTYSRGGGGGGGSSAKGNDSVGNTGGTGGAGTIGTLTGDIYGIGGDGASRPFSVSTASGTGSSATQNTGNGGNGSTSTDTDEDAGGNGGSGIVVIRYTIGAHFY